MLENQYTLIYSQNSTPRLEYILSYIFSQRWKTSFQLCNNEIQYAEYKGPKIWYDNSINEYDGIKIIPESILFETNIYAKNISYHRWKHTSVIFYNQPRNIIPFDIFGAIFYLITRYEEYLPFKKDKHGRFPAMASVAYKYSFLNVPVIDQWLIYFQKILFGEIIKKDEFKWEMTVDIDMIWKYKNKPPLLNYYGSIKDILKGNFKQFRERKLVLNGKIEDPFDCFDEMETLVKEPITYFVLTTEKSKFDRNTSPKDSNFINKIQELSKRQKIGIHPSYYAKTENQITQETSKLQKIISKNVDNSRQHFIQLQFPQTYLKLIKCGINVDYTMGYPDFNGFRASTSHPFQWFDLSQNRSTNLTVHSFQFMDATSLFYLKENINETIINSESIIRSTFEVGGKFIFIFHNYLLGDTINFPHQKQLLINILKLLQTIKFHN